MMMKMTIHDQLMIDSMKYLFVIYTDIEYKYHLDNFKSQEFYRQICNDSNIEVIEWGTDFHTDYKNLPIKTQEMMKWCSENKEYDYLIKCDDTIFMREDLKDEFVYENIFVDKQDYYGIKKRIFSYEEFYIEWYKNKGLGELDKSLSDIAKGYFYDGKCFVVSKDFSHFIGGQRGIAKIFSKRLKAMEDIMVSFIYREMYI
jgi:hypothetical protein